MSNSMITQAEAFIHIYQIQIQKDRNSFHHYSSHILVSYQEASILVKDAVVQHNIVFS
jgi:hypothetical protein